MEEFREYIQSLEERIVRLENHSGLSVGLEYGKDDELYEEAKSIVIREQGASSSYLQRKLGIGHMRAMRLMEALEEDGVISPMRGSKPREILTKNEV